MISRYEEKDLSALWSESHCYTTWLRAELAVLQALEEVGDVPAGTVEHIRSRVRINPERIKEIEKEVKHDVIAFCSSIAEQVEPSKGKFFHFGVTSSDILDSALSLRIAESLDLVLEAFQHLRFTLHGLAREMKDVVVMGRSHGMDAEPMSFGQKLLGHYNEFSRRQRELADFRKGELTVQFSGAVGNYTVISPERERRAAELLGLPVEPLSTQVIPRDRLAKLVGIGALTGGAVERLAVELRHLHKSDTGEMHEGFSSGQKGSSIMPHKKNPIGTENLTGMARLLRGHWSVAADNIVLWHERDISHSGAERVYLPDHLGLLLYALRRLNRVMKNAVFHREAMESKVLGREGSLSSYFLHRLLKETPLTREQLYPILQKASFAAAKGEAFGEALQRELEKEGRGLGENLAFGLDEIKRLYLGHVDEVFARSEEEYPPPSQ